MLSAAVAAGALSAEHAPIAVNCGFEDPNPSQGWSVPVNWKIVDGEGRRGSRALVWDSEDPKSFSFPVQYVALEPGARYTFGGWLKKVRGKPTPQICLGWSDATNKWISCVYAQAVTDNDARTDGWTRYEGRTPPMPSNAVKGLLHAHMKPGETGRVLYDDFTIVDEGGTEMIAYIACSALRNAFTSADGAIRFVAPLYVNTVRHPLKGLSAGFEYTDAGGSRVLRPADRFGPELAEMTCDAAKFACGTQKVELCIRDVATGEVLSRKSRRIVHTKKPVRRRVAFDRIGRTMVNGRPFFPLGCFSGRLDDDDIREFKKGPFNFFMPYGVVERDELDRYWAAGLMVSPCIMHKVHGLKYSVVSEFKTEAESHAWFRRYISGVKDHPALLSWFIIDELPLAFVQNVASVNDLLEEIDPDHPTWAVTDKPKHARALLPCYDVIGMDPYPVGNKGWRNDIGICSGWPREAREGMFDMRPMWQVPQVFNWAWYRKGDNDPPPDLRMPTRQEIANMCWQGVAAGANGLCLYSFGTIRKNLKGGEFDSAWSEVCDVAREVKLMEHVLLSDGEPMSIAGVPEDILVVRAWDEGGRDWALVVNRTKKQAKARLQLAREFRSLETAVGAGVALDGRNTLSVDLPGLGYAFVSFARE